MTGLLAALLLAASPASAAPASIRVVELHGALTAGGKPLDKGGTADGSEPIVLAEGGTALLSLPQGLIRLTGPATFTADRDSLTLTSGYALAVLRKLKRGWSFRTPSVVAAVRGTTFYVEAGEKSTYLCLCEGMLMINAPGAAEKDAQKLSTKTHESYAFDAKGGRLSRVPQPMRDHTDDEIALMKKRL